MAGLSMLLAFLIGIGIKGGKPPQVDHQEALRRRIAMGVRAGREHARVLLAYCCAFVARGDLVVIGTFYTLWLTQAGMQAGMSPQDAAQQAGIRFAMVMTAAPVWATSAWSSCLTPSGRGCIRRACCLVSARSAR